MKKLGGAYILDAIHVYRELLPSLANQVVKFELAEALSSLGLFTQSIVFLEELIAISDDKDATLFAEYANVLHKLGRNDKAGEWITRALNLDDHNTEWLTRAAMVSWELNGNFIFLTLMFQ